MPSALGLVFLGGTLGSAARIAVGWLLPAAPVPAIPLGTFAVNLVGAFLLGLLLEFLALQGDDSGRRRSARLLLGTGFLGGFTTYSAFSLENAELLLNGDVLVAALYAGVTLVAGGMLGWLGILLGRVIGQRRGRSAHRSDRATP